VALSGSTRRAQALLAAVDADHDGAVTEQEFTQGALALLRRAGSRRMHRKLEKLFDRVDANHDGNISKGELTSALEHVDARRKACRPQAQPTCTASMTSVTCVAVAITRYTAVAQTAVPQAAGAPSPTAPSTGA
jgi:hypothetical protein